MKLGNLGEQVVLMSKKAFGKIKFDSFEIAESDIYYHRRIERGNRANEPLVKENPNSIIAEEDKNHGK